ncbi:MAG: F0F1 ATP synthase subunit delta [Hyphomicrobiales bacterium]|nr:F0F1 ATP synthase subunit delta [Hyphomicrobiales bacterium]
MHIDWWTLGLQTVNALVLIWLLGRFLFQPVADAIAGRQKEAAQMLADAKAAKAAAEGERTKAEAEAARLADHRAEAFKAVEAEAAAAKSALLAKAQAEADKLVASAKVQIENDRRAEAHAADARSAELAVDIAAKLLNRLPPDARISGFMDGIAAGVRKLPEETRAALGAEGNPIRLTAASTVSPAEEGAFRESLSKVLGHAVAVDISVDPTLIAGIELAAPEAAVRNSFRADLARLQSELVHHDTDNA